MATSGFYWFYETWGDLVYYYLSFGYVSANDNRCDSSLFFFFNISHSSSKSLI